SHGEGQDEKRNNPTRRGSRRLDAERYRGPGIRHGLPPSAIAMSPQPIIGRALFGVDPASMALPLAVVGPSLVPTHHRHATSPRAGPGTPSTLVEEPSRRWPSDVSCPITVSSSRSAKDGPH